MNENKRLRVFTREELLEHGVDISADGTYCNVPDTDVQELHYYTDDFEGLKKLQENTPKYFGYWYILEWNDYYKIGYTTKPYNRYKSLINTAKYGNVKLGDYIVSDFHSNYKQNEYEMHECFQDRRIEDTELFDVTLDEILKEAYFLEYLFETPDKKATELKFLPLKLILLESLGLNDLKIKTIHHALEINDSEDSMELRGVEDLN